MKKLLQLLALVAIAVAGSASAQQPSQTGEQLNPRPAVNPQKTRPKRVHTDLSGFELSPKPTKANSSVQIGGGTRGGLPGLVLFAPRRAKCYTTTPTFHWGQAGAFTNFRLTVYDANQDVVYDAAIEGESFTYPASAPALEPGKTYSWTVQREGTLMAEPAPPVEWVLLLGEERKAVQEKVKAVAGESRKERIQRAEIWVNARLWYDAIEAYTALIMQYPNDADLYKARGEIYDQIPATQELAERDFLRAEDEQARRKTK